MILTRLAFAGILLGLALPGAAQATDPAGCPPQPSYVGYGELLRGLPTKRIAGATTVEGHQLKITETFGRIVSGGQRIHLSYRFEHSPHPTLAAALALARVSSSGRAGKVVARGRSHLVHRSLAVGLKVPSRGTVRYRLTLTLLEMGEPVKSLSEYLVGAKPKYDPRLLLGATTYRQSDSISGRMENFGSSFVTYGADFAFERLESGNWVAVGPPGIFPAIGYGLPAGAVSSCLTFRLPAAAPVGHYRVTKHVGRTDVDAEFDLVSG